MNLKKDIKASLLLALAAGTLVGVNDVNSHSAHASSYITQHGSALASYSPNYQFTRNRNYHYNTAKWHSSYQTDYGSNGEDVSNKGLNDRVQYWRGNQRVNFKTYAILNNNSQGYGDGDPQSIVAVHNYAYVLYGDGNDRVQILKYNLNHVNDHTLTAVKEGPKFKSGHGQGLAYNYRTHQLWLLAGSGASTNAVMQEISQWSLKPIRQIHFRFGQLDVPNDLTFDKRGNAYMVERTSSGRAPKGSLKLFRGRITNHSVHFKILKKGIRYAPGSIIQNINYNPKTDRIYIVADEGIISAPASKFGNLKPNDIKGTRFHGKREFEDLAFYGNRDFLLMNRGAKLMISNRLF